jgi:superfamily II DNA or RNA helicase
MQLGIKRKQHFNKIKLRILPKLLSKTSELKTVIFYGNIEDAPVGANLIHSKDKSSSKYLELFNNGEINHISSVEMITRGINLTKIEAGILMSLMKDPRVQIQKIGRVLRSESPIIYIVYVKGTKDETVLKTFISNYGGIIEEIVL